MENKGACVSYFAMWC